MYLPSESEGAYKQWLRTNRLFWASSAELSCADGTIYVDLFHDQPVYLQRNLITASILARKLGLAVVGLTGNVGVVPRSCPGFDPSRVVEIAGSYGIEVVSLPAEANYGRLVSQLNQGLVAHQLDAENSEGPALREFMRTWVLPDGFPLGRYVYDTFIRGDLVETVEDWNESLVRTAAQVLSLRDAVGKLFDGRAPTWFVTGHLDYAPFGLVAHETLRREGRLAFLKPERLPSVELIEGSLADGESLAGLHRKNSATWRNKVLDELVANHEADIARHFALSSTNLFYRSHRAFSAPKPALPAEAQQRIGRTIRSSFGWPTERRCVAIFAITTADIPLADEQIFSDNYQWMAETLAFAAEHPQCSWLIKIHPQESAYNLTNAMGRLQAMYSHLEHIRFVHEDWTPLAAMVAADVVSTIRGKPGVEAAALGKAIVVSGAGPYSDLGFGTHATTRAEYWELLLGSGDGASERDHDALRARAFLYAEDAVFAVQSPLMPAFAPHETGPGDWTSAESRLAWTLLETDPFCQALFEAVDQRTPATLSSIGDTSLRRSHGLQSNGSASPAEARLPRFVDFRQAGEMRAVPLYGLHGREEWGVWIRPPCAHVLVPVSQPFDGSLLVSVTCLAFFGMPTTLEVVVDGHAIGQPLEGTETQRLEFAFPEGRYGQDGFLSLEMRVGPGVALTCR